MANRDIIAIGTSAGGVAALLFLVRSLPRDVSAAILVTIHLRPVSPSSLDQLLQQLGRFPARFVNDGERLTIGAIHLAPPERHFLLIDDRVVLGDAPRENN